MSKERKEDVPTMPGVKWSSGPASAPSKEAPEQRQDREPDAPVFKRKKVGKL